MLAHDLRQAQLRAHAVGARNENRILHAFRRGQREQAAAAANVSDDLGAVRAVHGVLDGVHCAGALGRVHARLGIRHALRAFVAFRVSHVFPFFA